VQVPGLAASRAPPEFVSLERRMASSGLRPATPCPGDLARAKLRAMAAAPGRARREPTA